MARDRDVAAFGARAQRHDEGRLGELHHLIAGRGGAGSDLRASTQADTRRRVRDRLPAGELLRRAEGAWSPATAPAAVGAEARAGLSGRKMKIEILCPA